MDNIQASELAEGVWRRVALGHGLKLLTKNGHVYKYDGFRESVSPCSLLPLPWPWLCSLRAPEQLCPLHLRARGLCLTWGSWCFLMVFPPSRPTQEFDKLSDFFKAHYCLELAEKDLCVKGWNWGTVRFGGESRRQPEAVGWDVPASGMQPEGRKPGGFGGWECSDESRSTAGFWERSETVAGDGICGAQLRAGCDVPAGQLLSFDIGEQPVFEIPLSNVSQCTTGKNEVTLEFHQNDDAEVSLMEVRFYVPPTQEDGVDPVEVRGAGRRAAGGGEGLPL